MLMRHFSGICILYIYDFPHHWFQFCWTMFSWNWFAERCIFFVWLARLFVCFWFAVLLLEQENEEQIYMRWREKKHDQFSAALHWFDSIRMKKLTNAEQVCLFLTIHSFILAFSSLKLFFLLRLFSSINAHKMRKENTEREHTKKSYSFSVTIKQKGAVCVCAIRKCNFLANWR